jgi:hypothetical protein
MYANQVAHQLARNIFITKQYVIWDGDPQGFILPFVINDVTLFDNQLAEYPCAAMGEEKYASHLDASALPPLYTATARPLGTCLPNPYAAIATSSHFDKAFVSMGSDRSPWEEPKMWMCGPVRSSAPSNIGDVFLFDLDS